MSVLYFIIPMICIVLTTWFAFCGVKKGFNKKKAVVLQICSIVAIMAVCLFAPITHAAQVTSAAAAVSEAAYNAFGIGFIAMALSTGLAGIGGGIAVASAAPAAIAATSEDPKAFGKKNTKRAPKTLGKKPQNPKKRAGKGFGRTRETKGCL